MDNQLLVPWPTKNFKFEVKQINEEGTFWGHGAVFNIKDEYDDIVEPGAFTKTLLENPHAPILWQHNPNEPIGIPVSVVENDRGVDLEGQLNLDVERAREAHSNLKKGITRGLSYGYDAIKTTWEGPIRRIKELRLWEWSVVTFPAQPHALVVAVKSVVPYQDLPLAEVNLAWDANAAVNRVRSWAGGPNKEEVDWGKYQKAFLWYDSKDIENFGAYKLPIADVVDGALTAIPRGIFAAAAAIQGARGGVAIPDADVLKVKAHIAKYYKKLDRTPPWESETAGLELGLYSIIGASQFKVGRVLSASNRTLVQQAIEALQALLEAAEPSTDDTQKDQKPPDETGKSLEHLLVDMQSYARTRRVS